MDDKKKTEYDALMQQAEFNIHQFDGRREYSWKVTLGFWAAILGSVAVLKSELNSSSITWLILGALVIVLLHGYWLKKVFDADKDDKTFAFEFRDKAIELLNSEVPPKGWLKDVLSKMSDRKEKFKHREFIDDWSFQFQFFTTLFLLMAIVLFLMR